jgi:steroid delta-isomerase-like uncharacterized protein
MATSIQDKKAVVQRVETMVNDHDLDAIPEIFAEDLVVRFHGGREELRGREEFASYLAGSFEAFPDLSMTFEELVGEGDTVVVRYTGRGTHEGTYRGVEPTGRSVDLSGMRIARVEDGKITEAWGQRDDIGVLAQLGIVEPPTP